MKNPRVKTSRKNCNSGLRSQARLKPRNEDSWAIFQESLIKTDRKPAKSSRRDASHRPDLPLPSAQALKVYTHLLTEYEKREILEYQEVFYLGKLSDKLSFSNFDDEKADYRLHRGDHIAYRYEIIEGSGNGTFGQVCKCYDHKRKEHVAVKIAKNKKKLCDQATLEVKILQRVNSGSRIVNMKNFFVFRHHVCIVFELLGQSLYHYLQSNGSISTTNIKSIGRQLLESLQYTKRKGIIHCDLKLENIMFEKDSSDIKLIDFGSACHHTEQFYAYIQSRFYRAPEILLGFPYSIAIDMWSFGCVIYELATGVPLFPAESELDLMSRIIELIGTPPEAIIKDSSRKQLFFDSSGPLIVNNRTGKNRRPEGRKLEESIRDHSLVDLIQKCIQWDPEQRTTPSQAIDHPYFNRKEKFIERTVRSARNANSRR